MTIVTFLLSSNNDSTLYTPSKQTTTDETEKDIFKPVNMLL